MILFISTYFVQYHILNRSKLQSLYYVPAIRVEREDWIHSMKCQKAFKLVNKEVESRNHSTISADLAVSLKSVVIFDGYIIHVI